MTALVSICGGSLFLLASFFTFKDWEHQRMRNTFLTRFLEAHSPKTESLFRKAVSRVLFTFDTTLATVRALTSFGVQRITALGRASVVVVASHAIRVVRGEHLMAEGRIPSTYFKLLHRHKEKINGTDIPAGIAHPDVMRRVTITAEETVGGIPASAQSE